MKWLITLSLLLSSFAWSNQKPPELWSWFKDLEKSREACEIQSLFAIESLHLENQHHNEYGIYGNIKSNSVVIKCIEISPDKSKLMVAVAGHDRDSVEMVRNKIIQAIK